MAPWSARWQSSVALYQISWQSARSAGPHSFLQTPTARGRPPPQREWAAWSVRDPHPLQAKTYSRFLGKPSLAVVSFEWYSWVACFWLAHLLQAGLDSEFSCAVTLKSPTEPDRLARFQLAVCYPSWLSLLTAHQQHLSCLRCCYDLFLLSPTSPRFNCLRSPDTARIAYRYLGSIHFLMSQQRVSTRHQLESMNTCQYPHFPTLLFRFRFPLWRDLSTFSWVYYRRTSSWTYFFACDKILWPAPWFQGWCLDAVGESLSFSLSDVFPAQMQAPTIFFLFLFYLSFRLCPLWHLLPSCIAGQSNHRLCLPHRYTFSAQFSVF